MKALPVSPTVGGVRVLGTGLNRWDDSAGTWVPADAGFEGTPDGEYVARHTAHQVILARNLNADGAVDLLTPDGQRLRSTPVGLAYWDSSTGRTALLAEVRDCRGEWVSPTEILYPDAFDGLAADVRFTIGLDRFEQDVIIRAAPPGPQRFGLDPSRTQLVVLTEFHEAPSPAQAGDEAPGWLRFGAMVLAPGRAFLTGVPAGRTGADDQGLTVAAGPSPADSVPVVKSWEVMEGRAFLVEAVEYSAVATALADLPSARQAAVEPKAAKDAWALPGPRPGQVACRGVVWPDRIQEMPATEAPCLAASPPDRVGAERPGLVLDYVLLTSQTSLTLAGDTTYYVTGSVNVQNLTIEGGTVVKYDTPSSARISVSSSVTCRTGPYRPAFFTHKFDSTVGELVATGDPTAGYVGYPMLDLSTTSGGGGLTVEHLRFRHAQTAVKLNGASTLMLTYTLRHAQFVRCQFAINAPGNSSSNPVKVVAGNLLAANVGTFLTGYYFHAVLEHLTADSVGTLASGGFATNPVAVTNSILANVSTPFTGPIALSGSHNGFWNCTPFGGPPQYTAQSTPFEAVAAGSHYLDQGSDFVDTGSFNVSSTLLKDLRKMTTRGPVRIVALSQTEDQAFLPHDVEWGQIGWQDGDAPDLGYHYALLDYYATGLNLGRTLALAEGVAIGFYGATGITLGPGAKLVSVGTPHTPYQLVRLQAVQEMAASPYTNQSPTMTLFKVSSTYSPWPEVSLHYTDISLPAGSYDQCHVLDARQTPSTLPTYPLTSLVLNHCQIWGGRMMFYPGWPGTTVTATNVLWHRGYLYCDQKRYYGTQPFLLTVLNNLFYGGTFECHYSDTSTPWTIKDNLFDRVTLLAQGSANTDSAHNGYHQATALPGPGTGNKTLTTVNYLNGPRGYHYYPNSGTTGLRALVNAGSTSAESRDLYLFTTHENQAPEGNTTLDIGYHYPPAVKFQTVTTNLVAAVDLDYHPGNQSLIVSVNFKDGDPMNFQRVTPGTSVTAWSSASGFEFEIPLTTSQTTIGLFTVGETYFGESPSPDHSARIWQISPGGVLDPSYWVELEEPNSDPLKREDAFKPQSICVDPTGVFDHDMLVVTGWLEQNSGGNVWRVNHSDKTVTLLAALGECLEGVMVCPNDAGKYGPALAGKLLVGAGTQRRLHLVDPQGGHTSMDLGMTVFDMHVVPAGQPLYCLDFRFKPGTANWSSYFIGSSRLLKVGADFFATISGDILLVRSGEATAVDHLPDGALFLLHWTGSRYVTLQVSDDFPRIIEHVVFAPVSIPSTQ